MAITNNGFLVVVSRAAIEVGQRVLAQECPGLWADSVHRNTTAGEGLPRGGIEDLCCPLRKVSVALRRCGHPARLGADIAILRPLVVEGQIGAIAEQVRNSQRAAERGHALKATVVWLGRLLACE